MTDKELIKQEIERRYNCEKCHPLDIEAHVAAAVLQELLLFIDSLPEEPASEDLEEAAKHYLYGAVLYDDVYVGNPTEEDCIRCFKAGAKWQKQQIKEALQTEYEKGRFDMREEMMKNAVEGTVKYEIGSAEIPQCDRRYQILSDPTPIANAKLGDKVKIIIVKTEQQ